MNDIDKKIREALQEDDARYLEDVETELPILKMVLEVFQGRSRWLVILGCIAGIVFMALGVYSGVRFFQAEVVHDMLAWSLGIVFCMAAVTAMKIWFWLELNKTAVTREVKRVELQLAQLSGRLRELQKGLER